MSVVSEYIIKKDNLTISPNVGDLVKMKIPAPYFPEFFPARGIIGEVIHVGDKDGCWVKWPKDSIKAQSDEDDLIRFCDLHRLEIVR